MYQPPDPITREEFYLANIAENVNDVSGDINIEDGVAKGYSYSIRIPDGVTSIADSAFTNCYSLKSLIIPDGVTSIGKEAFNGCSSLKSLIIPNGVTSIGDDAFRKCSSLELLTIPDSVTSIDTYAFWKCTSLKELHLKRITPPTLANTKAFESMPANCVIYVPTGSLNAYKTASNWSTWASQMIEEE